MKTLQAPGEVDFLCHEVAEDDVTCARCGIVLPTHKGKEGQIVSVISSFTKPDVAYLIGRANREPMCDGTPAEKFAQK